MSKHKDKAEEKARKQATSDGGAALVAARPDAVGGYADGTPFDRIQYLEAKLIRKRGVWSCPQHWSKAYATRRAC